MCWLQELQDIIGKEECLPFTGKALHRHASECQGDLAQASTLPKEGMMDFKHNTPAQTASCILE